MPLRVVPLMDPFHEEPRVHGRDLLELASELLELPPTKLGLHHIASLSVDSKPALEQASVLHHPKFKSQSMQKNITKREEAERLTWSRPIPGNPILFMTA